MSAARPADDDGRYEWRGNLQQHACDGEEDVRGQSQEHQELRAGKVADMKGILADPVLPMWIS